VKVHFVVPDMVDDPQRPSGGNSYDRRLAEELRVLGWAVTVVPASGSLDDTLRAISPDEVVLIDGLLACAAAADLASATGRLRVVVLVHMPVEECARLASTAAIVTTSAWTRDRLITQYHLPPQLIHLAEPGVDLADPAPGTGAGGSILCVGAVAAHKGQDLLLDALAELTDLSWQCTCIGALDRDPAYVAALRRHPAARRVDFAGVRTGADLERSYASADVLVLPSRTEAYGMVVTEALARALPVIAAGVGGVPEALGRLADGRLPGVLVRPDSPADLAHALRRWLEDQALRDALRAAAHDRSSSLAPWTGTALRIAEVLRRAAAPLR
jgi:glycosyltransferase involved in cell wall biosynthesis